MVNILGSALPQFSSNEMKNLKNSKSDFLGINHYTSYFIQDCLISACNSGEGASKSEGFALKLDRKGNISIGELVSTFEHIFSKVFPRLPSNVYNITFEMFVFLQMIDRRNLAAY